MIEIKFTAVAPVVQGWKNGIDVSRHKFYDCSFSLTFDQTKVQSAEVNQMIQNQIMTMQREHPNSRVLKQHQRQF